MSQILRIGTRKSQLALWQAYFVKAQLEKHYPGIEVELVEIVSAGDKHLKTPLAKIGGKGLFLKELETSLLEGETDIAVHSMKDVTVQLPKGLHIPVICERENPRDAFVSNKYESLNDLPDGARVGTCSLRRKCQLAAKYPNLELIDLRGNVNTRLARLDNGDFDAIILAAAGLIRLEFNDRIRQDIPTEVSLPAVGQGAVGIECRIDDERINQLVAPLNHLDTAVCVQAERAANERLGGGCHVPIAAFAEKEGETLKMRGLVGAVSGEQVLRTAREGSVDHPVELGQLVAQDLIDEGAQGILKVVYDELGES